jgi:hypothetical protein
MKKIIFLQFYEYHSQSAISKRVSIPSRGPISLVTPKIGIVPHSVQRMAANKISDSPINIGWGSTNYQPPTSHYDYIQSLTSEYLVHFFFFFLLFVFLVLVTKAEPWGRELAISPGPPKKA